MNSELLSYSISSRLKKIDHSQSKTMQLRRTQVSIKCSYSQQKLQNFSCKKRNDISFLSVECTAGTFDSDDGRCSKCPVGTYQPKSGQSRCIPCGEGLTTEDEGATNRQQCSPTSKWERS